MKDIGRNKVNVYYKQLELDWQDWIKAELVA